MADDSLSALKWENVDFSVRHGFWMKPKTLLHDITISLDAGSVLGLVGPNGAGKTTTLKLGAGIIAPGKGSVFINGINASEPIARRQIGLLTESQYVYPYLKLREWLAMLGSFSGLRRGTLSRAVDEVLEIVDLTGREKQIMRTLSKGQVQRAGLAQALIHNPSILILDEPMSGLDPFWRYRMQKILMDLKNNGKTIIFSSHIFSDVERLCDKVILIRNGQICWEGILSDLPRKKQGYEAICRADDPELLMNLMNTSLCNDKLMRLPDGNWRLTISEKQKRDLFKLISSGKVELAMLKPIQQEVEEVLFGFTSDN